MSGVNKVILLGRLGRDPEIKDAKGVAIANFSIATSKSWKDESGEKKEKTEWHNIVCFKKTAELAGKYLTKGRQVYIEGELQTRSWDDKETGAKKYKTEVVAHNLQFIGDSKTQSETAPSFGESNAGPEPTFNTNEEIPF
jgi:single-strand DNA-binding protein